MTETLDIGNSQQSTTLTTNSTCATALCISIENNFNLATIITKRKNCCFFQLNNCSLTKT